MSPIQADPDILAGTPCFAGTRVPVRTLFDLLQRGHTLETFLEGFPTVSHEQVVAVTKAGVRAGHGDRGRRRLKLLLDECVDQHLRSHIPGNEVATVGYMGWSGVNKGELLRLASQAGFDALVTTDPPVGMSAKAA